MSTPFQEQMSAGMAAWRAVQAGPKTEAGPMADKITLDCGLDGDGRQALGAYMRVVAARTATQGSPEAKLIASCVSAIGDKLAAAPGRVEIKVSRLDAEQRMRVRRVLWTAADRARSGLAETGVIVRDGAERLLAEWEAGIGYDADASWKGPRNAWGEPPAAGERLGIMFSDSAAESGADGWQAARIR